MKKNTVVLIDDEYTKITYFEIALVDKGYDVTVLKDVNPAWDHFKIARPEVCAIILDLLLPKPKALNNNVLAFDSVIGVHVQKHLLDQLKATNQLIPVAILTQLSRSENLEVFEHLEKEQRTQFPNWPLQTWMKVGLDPDDFATEFATWLKSIQNLSKVS